jgi:hypothetical protein
MMHPREKKAQSGQILVLFMMMLTTLVILLGMVISVGHLVQSKISLQNGVDLSAMSGASWQARFMNGTSLINYRMRQNYKWFLFDVYVTQSRFNGGFREQVDGGGGGEISNPEEVFGICQQSFGYEPTFEGGRGTSDRTDMCKNAIQGGGFIPPIIPSPAPSYNPVYIAINLAIMALAAEAQAICAESADQNKKYYDYTTDRFAATNDFQGEQFEKVVADFGNAFGDSPLVGGSTADATMQATFRDNLLRNVKSGGATLMWLNPPQTRQRAMGDFEAHDVRMFMNYVNFEPGAGCLIKIERAAGKQGKVGFSVKEPDRNPLHVAVSGVSQPRVLFWPSGPMPVMGAVGAAKPFGSRIGPPGQNFEKETNSGNAGMANMFVTPEDNGRGMYQIEYLQQILSTFPARWSGRPALRPSTGAFMELVNAPTKYEALFYNPFLDSDADYVAEAIGAAEVKNGSYAHLDTRPEGPWHSIGGLLGGKFYATPNETRNSWSATSGRKGYQIKLLSIPQLCAETDAAKRGPLEQLYCTDPNLRIFH